MYNPDQMLAKRLLEMQIVTAEQLQECQTIQKRMPRLLPLAFILIDKGYLNDENLEQIVQQQKGYFRYLAKYDLENILGEQLIQAGLITLEQLQECQRIQMGQNMPVPLLFILEEKGYLNTEHIEQIVRQQTHYFRDFLGKSSKSLGQICVEQGWITPLQLENALQAQRKLRQRGKYPLGKILLRQKLISPEQLAQALEMQGKTMLSCPPCHKNFNVRHFNTQRQYRCPSCSRPLVPKSSKQSSLASASDAPTITSPERVTKGVIAIAQALDKVSTSSTKSPCYLDADSQRRISKGVIAIAQALDNEPTETESQEAEWADTAWWMDRIDGILAQQEPDNPRPISLSSHIILNNRQPPQSTRNPWVDYLVTIALGMNIGVILFLLITPTESPSTALPPSPPSPAPSPHQPQPVVSPTTDSSSQLNIPVDTQDSAPHHQGAMVSVSPTPHLTLFQKELRACHNDHDRICTLLARYQQNQQLEPRDLAVLQALYLQFPQDNAIHYLTIAAAALTNNPNVQIWLEEILQSGSFNDKISAVKALRQLKDPKALTALLTALRNARNEHLVRYIAQALCSLAPKNEEVFSEVTNLFYQCRDLSVRSSLLREIYHFKTGREDLFLLRVIADPNILGPLRSTAVNLLANLAHNPNKRALYYSQLEGIMAQEPENDFKKFLKSTLARFK